jgi:hypothetical protein
MAKNEITKKYLEKYGDTLTKLQIAKLLLKDGHFKNLNSARGSVKYYTGSNGESSRKELRDKTYLRKLTYNTVKAEYRQEEVYGRILILDIETAPLLANIWGIWNQNISTENIRSDWFILTWAAKWLFDTKVYSARVTPKEAQSNNDKRIVKSLLDMLNDADIVVTHNGDRFDLPRINTRALIHGLNPPLPYISIDTLKSAKKHFNFTSNKLDYINKVLKLPQKTHTDMELWRGCFNGDESALKKMEKYNINDVRIHEQTYLTMRPFIKPHPNIGLHILDDKERCPTCGGSELTMMGKLYHTTMNVYEMFRCKCGATGRKRKATKRSGKLLSSTPR